MSSITFTIYYYISSSSSSSLICWVAQILLFCVLPILWKWGASGIWGDLSRLSLLCSVPLGVQGNWYRGQSVLKKGGSSRSNVHCFTSANPASLEAASGQSELCASHLTPLIFTWLFPGQRQIVSKSIGKFIVSLRTNASRPWVLLPEELLCRLPGESPGGVLGGGLLGRVFLGDSSCQCESSVKEECCLAPTCVGASLYVSWITGAEATDLTLEVKGDDGRQPTLIVYKVFYSWSSWAGKSKTRTSNPVSLMFLFLFLSEDKRYQAKILMSGVVGTVRHPVRWLQEPHLSVS